MPQGFKTEHSKLYVQIKLIISKLPNSLSYYSFLNSFFNFPNRAQFFYLSITPDQPPRIIQWHYLHEVITFFFCNYFIFQDKSLGFKACTYCTVCKFSWKLKMRSQQFTPLTEKETLQNHSTYASLTPTKP